MPNEFARALRNAPTNAEHKLWPFLRRKNLYGLRIRRQFPLGPYVADFACLPARLVVELDGDTHLADGAEDRDAARTRFMQSRGFEVVRYWNIDVYNDAVAVADAIGATIERRMRELGLPLPIRA